MDHDNYSDTYIRGILNTVKTIAMVGVSANTSRPSYFAFKYLMERGYRMIPVNPGLAGQELLGQKVYAKLADIPLPVDMVDIFRASRYAPDIVREALALEPRPQVIWMQLGVRSDEAAELAEGNGLKVVMNRCPKIEYGRLSSEIAWMGVNTRTITARKPQLFGRGIQRMGLNRVTLTGGSTEAATQAQKIEESKT
ncbi:MAG: CoA-binding protein [Xanthobacteraceae bacterium]|jgi:predicted CoA-binding protein